jgi:endoglucanase
MQRRRIRRGLPLLALLALVAATVPIVASAGASRGSGDRTLPAGTRFSVRIPDQAAVQQIADLVRRRQLANAGLLTKMETTPQAVWVTKGTPSDARRTVLQAVALATVQHAVPVLVAYDVPGRDCANLSAGGATTTADYEAWIDGFAQGIGNAKAVVILEPDGLGLLPGSNCGGPKDGYPYTDDERYAEINFAVDRLDQQPNAIVYLDGTHTAWQNVHDAATRLIAGGVLRAQGFFLNVSNYQFAPNNAQYGEWISKCITRIQAGNNDCPDQYWNGGPLPSLDAQLFGEWNGVALDRYSVWSDTSTVQDRQTSAINLRYADTTGTVRYVIDTSRDGLGPWQYPASYGTPPGGDGAALDWCNAPGRALGPRPAAQPDPAHPLLDAYLWIKTPGESDGTCNRAGAPAGSPDPEWGGIVDPAAGAWFPQEALQLAQLASSGV